MFFKAVLFIPSHEWVRCFVAPERRRTSFADCCVVINLLCVNRWSPCGEDTNPAQHSRQPPHFQPVPCTRLIRQHFYEIASHPDNKVATSVFQRPCFALFWAKYSSCLFLKHYWKYMLLTVLCTERTLFKYSIVTSHAQSNRRGISLNRRDGLLHQMYGNSLHNETACHHLFLEDYEYEKDTR